MDSYAVQSTHHQPSLLQIMRLVQHITKRSCKLFILYFVTNYLPEGADQIDAAHECYRFALEHADEFAGAERTQRTVTQIRRKYPMLKTQHLMHAHGLADERLFQLVERPRELIEALYGHEAVLRRVHTVDINAVRGEEGRSVEVSELLESDWVWCVVSPS